jgi:hypothetical protein
VSLNCDAGVGEAEAGAEAGTDLDVGSFGGSGWLILSWCGSCFWDLSVVGEKEGKV